PRVRSTTGWTSRSASRCPCRSSRSDAGRSHTTGCDMPTTYTQDNRALRITTPLGPGVLLLERIQGEERISAPFRFVADLLSEDPNVAASALLGKSVTVEVDFAAETRYINGIVSRFSQGDNGMRFTRYRIEIVPELW